jgi:hypothetical protein
VANANVRQISPGPIDSIMTDVNWVEVQKRLRLLEEFLSQATFGGAGTTPPSPTNKFLTVADIDLSGMKSGSTQEEAGAVAGELWFTVDHGMLPDNVVMRGA